VYVQNRTGVIELNQRKKLQRTVAKKLRSGGITLVGMLRNSNVYDGQKAECCCFKLVSNRKEGDGHVCLKARDLGIEHTKVKRILNMNNKSSVTTDYKKWIKIVNKNILEFLNKNGIKNYNKCIEHLNQNEYEVNNKAINYIKKKYKGCIFTEVDKNQNAWCVMCPVEYHRRMKETFVNDNKT